MAVEQLLQHVHPDAVYHRVPLPDDQNALGPWREAIEHYVPPDKDDPLWGDLIYGAGEKGEPVAFPSGPEGNRLRALLDRNQKALELLRRGNPPRPTAIARRAWRRFRQVERRFPLGVSMTGPTCSASKARHCVADGDDVGVCRLRVQLLRSEKCSATATSGAQTTFLAMDIGNGPSSGFKRLPTAVRFRDRFSANYCRRSSAALASPDGLEQSMRLELCCMDLPKINQLPESGELEDFVDQLLQMFYGTIAP